MSDKAKPTADDWRRRGQERFLKNVVLVRRSYRLYREGWDHDHCEFCWAKFSLGEGDLNRGYSTEDEYRWVCESCVDNFKDEFGWTLRDDSGSTPGSPIV